MVRYRIIEFRGVGYAILKKRFGFDKEYVSLNADITWVKPKDVKKYCIGSKSDVITRYYELIDDGKDVTEEVLKSDI